MGQSDFHQISVYDLNQQHLNILCNLSRHHDHLDQVHKNVSIMPQFYFVEVLRREKEKRISISSINLMFLRSFFLTCLSHYFSDIDWVRNWCCCSHLYFTNTRNSFWNWISSVYSYVFFLVRCEEQKEREREAEREKISFKCQTSFLKRNWNISFVLCHKKNDRVNTKRQLIQSLLVWIM